MTKTCTDCDGVMERAKVTSGGYRFYIETERDGGILDSLGLNKNAQVQTFVCKDCGLIKFYAEEET